MAPPTSQDVVMLAMMTRGEVVVPDNEREYEYQVTKGHNVMLHETNKPVMFLLCHDEGDVKEGLQFALKHDLPISIRSGGHGVAGDSCRDGSFVIDLSRMNHVRYDAESGDLIYQPGAVLADLTVTALRHDRMVTTGIAPPTGTGGLTLHGGIGFLTQTKGMAVDNITRVRVLTAAGGDGDGDGRFHTVGSDSTASEDRDLFFAVRGAAGALGVVTEIRIRTYPSERVTGGMWAMADDAAYTATRASIHRALRVVREQEEDPNRKRTFTGGIYMATFPPLPDIPVEKHGKPCSLMYCGMFGADDDTQAAMAEFVDRPVEFGVAPAPVPFGVFHQMLAGMFLNFPPFAPYWKNAFCKEVPSAAKVDEFCDTWASGRTPYMGASLVGFEFSGGSEGKAHAERINGDTSHCVTKLRDYLVVVPAMMYTPPDPAMVEQARTLARKLHSIFDDMQQPDYVNGRSGEDCNEAELEKFGKAAYQDMERIKSVKQRVDPKNVFQRKFIKV